MQNDEWQVEVDQCTAGEWSHMLGLFSDANIYQTWSYGQIRWGKKNLSHLVLKRSGVVVGIAQLRLVRPTMIKFGMAYLRWGPLCQRHGEPLEEQVVFRMARAIEAEYVDQRKLFLRILPNAFTGSSRGDTFQSAFSRFDTEPSTPENTYRTFVVDLAPSLENLRKQLDKKWRNRLSRAERNNLQVSAGSGGDDFRVFRRIYDQMLRRKAFDTTVDVEEFGKIQDDLAERQRMRIFICRDQGVPVSGLVVSAMGDSAIYLLGATSDAGLQAQGSYLLHWTAIQWLKENDVRWYDLGGIDPVVNPGVYSFKQGFAGVDVVQLSPLVACNSAVSSAVVRTSMALRRMLGTWPAVSVSPKVEG